MCNDQSQSSITPVHKTTSCSSLYRYYTYKHRLCIVQLKSMQQYLTIKSLKTVLILVFRHASGTNQLKTLESVRFLNLHKAYNIRVGLFVESLVSNPSTQARPRKQGEEGERRTVSVSNNKQRKVSLH